MDSRAARRALHYATWLTKLPLKNPSRDREVSAFADDAKFRVSKPCPAKRGLCTAGQQVKVNHFNGPDISSRYEGT